MPQSIACQTTTLGNLLRVGDTYIIPPFQRNYAWEDEQFEDFWNDILRTFVDGASEYLLGSIVLNNSRAPDLLVIDGQQRLTTASILISALRCRLREQQHDALARLVENDFLAKSDYQQQLFMPSLILNGHDQPFYNDYIFHHRPHEEVYRFANDESVPRSNRLLARCFRFMDQKINWLCEKGLETDQIAKLLIEAYNRNLVLIRIDVKDDQNAFVLFEALNERGRDLSKFDLLKNHLYSVSGGRLRETQSNWEIMSQNLGFQKTVKFIRHHWMSNYEAVSEKDLYGRIKTEIRTSKDVERYSADLCEVSDLYSAFTMPNHNIWGTFSNDERHVVRRFIERIELFKAEQLFVVLLATLDTNRTTFVDMLKMLTTFTFRYNTICGLGASNLQTAFVNAAQHLRKKKRCSAKDIFKQFLAKYYPDDSQFHSAFARKSIKNNALARYILAEINDYLCASPSLTTQKDPFATDLEHILPKKNEEFWRLSKKDFPGGPDRYVYRLGNMTLISTKLNQNIGNADFKTKKRAYARDCLDITKRVLDEDKWTADEINRRQNWMAGLAEKIWSYP